MRVVFMGTPDIAATCLKQILADGYQVVGVYTQPDRPKNRGMKLAYSAVKEVALAEGLPVFQPESFRDEAAVEQLRQLKPDVVAVVAYGRILPKVVLDMLPNGFINIHASVLPQYRGSAPYQWAVLDGQKRTGVSAQFMAQAVDAGDVVGVSETDIDPEETAGELLDRLAQLGAALLSKTLGKFRDGTLVPQKQDESRVTYAPMLDKSMCPIDWHNSARKIHDQVRGLNPWPVATTELQGKRFKIYKTAVIPCDHGKTPGTILALTKTGLQIACGTDAVELRILQAEGGKRMAAPDYFRGHPLEF